MPKIPTVTLGTPTAQRTSNPQATFGTATGINAPTLLNVTPPQKVNRSLAQAIEQSEIDAPVITIAELTGQRRVITLRGRALPYRGSLKFTSQQRIDEGEYTGFPRVNHTVLGGRELDTEMNGVWKDRFLGDESAGSDQQASAFIEDFVPDGVSVPVDSPLSAFNKLLSARDLCLLFESLAYEGPPLRFKWLHIRRIGRLEKFEQDWQNPHDVAWKMTFKWISRDEQVGLPSPAQTTLTGLADAFKAGAVDVHEATNFDDLDDLDPRFADTIDIGVGKIEAAIAEVEDTIENRVQAIGDATSALRRVTSIGVFLRDQAQQLIDALDEVVYPAMVAVKQPGTAVPTGFSFDVLTDVSLGKSGDFVESLTSVPPGAAISAACQNRAAARAARHLKHVAARQRFSAIRQLEADSIGVVTIRDGEDLRDVAATFYGDSADWEQIRSYNELSTVSPPIGTVVFVPASGTRPR